MASSYIVSSQLLSKVPLSFLTPGLVVPALLILFVVFLYRKAFPNKLQSKLNEIKNSDGEGLKLLEGPKPWPLLGSLHLLGEHEIPFEGFTRLAKTFGDIFSIRLGSTDCVVVNSTELRDEVLIAKANDFDGRPQFERFRMLFGGDKQNALAFCDFSSLQSLRREILSTFTFPHSRSSPWAKLDEICQSECRFLQDHISQRLEEDQTPAATVVIDIKPLILKACANIFNRYFCASRRFPYSDPAFSAYVSDFDHVFWEVNTGRLPDFIPWMTPLATIPILRSKRCAGRVRSFVEKEMVEERMERAKVQQQEEEIVEEEEEEDKVFLDALMPYLLGQKPEMPADKAFYALEDILGGHCAVGCITIRILADLAAHRQVQEEIRSEMAEIASDSTEIPAPSPFALGNAEKLHWTRAAIFETVRLTCSPIVPHRATRDSSIGGYLVKKDTVIFVNNHELSMSEKYWKEGETHLYKPTRFLRAGDDQEGCEQDENAKLRFRRPWHYKPFSHGKRSCMGYKMVENISRALVTALMEKFELQTTTDDKNKLPKGVLGLPDKPVVFEFRKAVVA